MTETASAWHELGRAGVEAVRVEAQREVESFRQRMADLVAALQRVAGEVRALDQAHRVECSEASAALAQPEVERWTGFEVQSNVRAARAAAGEALGLMANLPVIDKQLRLLAAVTAAELRAEPLIESRWRGQVRDLGLLNSAHGIRARVGIVAAARAWLDDAHRRGAIWLAPPPVTVPTPPRPRPKVTVKTTYDIFARTGGRA